MEKGGTLTVLPGVVEDFLRVPARKGAAYAPIRCCPEGPAGIP